MLKKNRASPKSGLEGPKRSKNGVLAIFLADNSFKCVSEVLCSYGLSNFITLVVKLKSGWPEIRAGGPLKVHRWGLIHFSC